jgi:hypothetical protein
MDRRLAIGGSAWSPLQAGPTAWYYASGQYVTLSGANVSAWADRLANGNDIIQGVPGFQPTWESVNSWGANRSSIRAVSQPLNEPSGVAPVVANYSGNARPFTALVTCQDLFLSSSSTVCKWTGAGGVLQSCIINGSNFLSMTRSDGADTNTITATANAIGSGHIRLAFTFDGQTGIAYLGTLPVVSGSIHSAPIGSLAFTSFTLGDVRDLRYVETVIYPRALAAEEVAAYNAYSLNEWG